MQTKQEEKLRRRRQAERALSHRGSTRQVRNRALYRQLPVKKSGKAASGSPPNDNSGESVLNDGFGKHEPRDMAWFFEVYQGRQRPQTPGLIIQWQEAMFQKLLKLAMRMYLRRFGHRNIEQVTNLVINWIDHFCKPGAFKSFQSDKPAKPYLNQALWRMIARPNAQMRFEQRISGLGEEDVRQIARSSSPDMIVSNRELVDLALDMIIESPDRSRRVLITRTNSGSRRHRPKRNVQRTRARKALQNQVADFRFIAPVRLNRDLSSGRRSA